MEIKRLRIVNKLLKKDYIKGFTVSDMKTTPLAVYSTTTEDTTVLQ